MSSDGHDGQHDEPDSKERTMTSSDHDRRRRRRIFLGGLGVLTAASLARVPVHGQLRARRPGGAAAARLRRRISVPAAHDARVTLTIRGPLARDDLPGLFARTCALLATGDVELLRCEITDVAADAVAVEALARLALAARRAGAQARLSGASKELLALVAFMGLERVLRSGL
jgi:ABC-type transporter Mla MlaB component